MSCSSRQPMLTGPGCAREVARRAKQLRINPSLPPDQLLAGASADDLEKVLETRVGRVHFVQVGNDDEVSTSSERRTFVDAECVDERADIQGKAGLASLANKGLSMGVYEGLSEEFIQTTLS